MPPELYASTGHASAKKRNKIPRAANLGEDADARRSFGDGDAMRVSVTWEKVDARADLPVGAAPLDSDAAAPADARVDRPLDDDAAENAPRAPAAVPDAFDDDAFAFPPGADPAPAHPEPPGASRARARARALPFPPRPRRRPRQRRTPQILRPDARGAPRRRGRLLRAVRPARRRRPTPAELRPNLPQEGGAFATHGASQAHS